MNARSSRSGLENVWRLVTVSPASAFAAGAVLLAATAVGVVLPLLDLQSAVGAVGLTLAVLLCCAAVLVVGSAAMGAPRGVLIFLGVTVFIVDATFRQREITAQGIDWQTLLKLCIWLGAIVIAWRNTHRPIRALFGEGIRWLSIFSLMAVFSTVYSLTPAYTLGAGVSALAYCALAVCIVRRFDRETILLTMLYGLSALLLASVLVYLAGYGRAVMEGGAVIRVGGIAGSPNGLGRAAALALLVIGVLKLQYRHPLLGLRLLVPLSLAVVCLALSESRTSVVAVLFAFGLDFARRRALLACLLLLPLAFAGVLLMLLDIDWANFGALLSRTGKVAELTTLTGRTEIWAASWSAFLERPILGYGFGATKVLLPEIYRTVWGFTVTHAHNMLLQALVTTGLLGIVPVIFAIGRQVVEYVQRPGLFQTAVLGYIVIQGFTEPGPLGTAPNLITLFWALSLCWHNGSDSRKGQANLMKGGTQ